MKADKITSANQMLECADSTDDKAYGELAISALKEFYIAFREILVKETNEQQYLAGYLEAYDRVTSYELQMLRDLGNLEKAEFGKIIRLSALVYELIAFDMLLKGEGSEADKKKKKAGEGLMKELQELKEAWFFKPPQWVETILKSIVDIFS